MYHEVSIKFLVDKTKFPDIDEVIYQVVSFIDGEGYSEGVTKDVDCGEVYPEYVKSYGIELEQPDEQPR